MMAYVSSVHKKTGYTPRLLASGQEKNLLLDCMYSNVQKNETADIYEFL